MNEKTTYFIKAPTGSRKSWSVVGFTKDESCKRQYFTVKDGSIQAVNSRYKRGEINDETARLLLDEFINTLYQKQGKKSAMFRRASLSAENQKLLESFWQDKYAHKLLEDEASTRSEFVRTLKYIGDVSLYNATAGDIQTALKATTSNVRQWRRAIDRIREILAYLDRPDVVLQKPKEGIREVKHINRQDLELLIKQLSNPVHRTLAITLFCTGLRLGEAMALTENDISDKSKEILVNKQLTRTGKLKRPKREREGWVVSIPFGWDAIKQWVSVEDKDSHRYGFYREITKASRSIWPKDRVKHISPHDLRHSHAIYLLSQGATLEDVSMNLRNRIEVCQKYYTGFCHNRATSDRLRRILK